VIVERTLQRIRNRWRRVSVSRFGRRDFNLHLGRPYVSFTFDDFPCTALATGGRILEDHQARGTYFVSLALLGGPSPSGEIASRGDLRHLLRAGHELGCHTFEHLDGWRSSPAAFERSIEANQAALRAEVPGGRFDVFAYPLDGPVLSIKKAVGKYFVSCRGGGQTHNAGAIDLNLLNAYFLDWRNRGDLQAVREVIERNAADRGWLIFGTHDIAPSPSRYGCEPEFFEAVVRMSLQSGARVLPMGAVCKEFGLVD
jgi:peptidoglycan/xylan/chitin deacetylase (PgdA/CDA1 family)